MFAAPSGAGEQPLDVRPAYAACGSNRILHLMPRTRSSVQRPLARVPTIQWITRAAWTSNDSHRYPIIARPRRDLHVARELSSVTRWRRAPVPHAAFGQEGRRARAPSIIVMTIGCGGGAVPDRARRFLCDEHGLPRHGAEPAVRCRGDGRRRRRRDHRGRDHVRPVQRERVPRELGHRVRILGDARRRDAPVTAFRSRGLVSRDPGRSERDRRRRADDGGEPSWDETANHGSCRQRFKLRDAEPSLRGALSGLATVSPSYGAMWRTASS